MTPGFRVSGNMQSAIHDPGFLGELMDIGPHQPRLREELLEALESWHNRRTQDVTTMPLTLDPEDIERLRALGYVE